MRTSRGIAAAVLVAVTGVCLARAGPVHAVFPGENGRIAYTDLDGHIHTILPSGEGDTLIAAGQGPGSYYGLAWSPNGRRIGFQDSVGNIHTMRADGSDVRQLTLDGENRSMSYAPNGHRIVFLDHRKIVVMRGDGSKRRVIGHALSGVTWSPNGRIAYTRGGDPRGSLWAMRPDGTHKHRLVLLGNHGGSLPLYSPDGSEFLFVRSWQDFSSRTLLADATGDNVRRPPCEGALSAEQLSHYGSLRFPVTYSPDGRSFLVWNANQMVFPPNIGALGRVSLDSCAGKRVIGPATGDAAWQALPTP